MKLLLRPLDYLIIVASIGLVVVATMYASDRGSTPKLVQIETESQTLVYPIDEDRELEVEGPLGHSHIAIRDGRVRFVDSPCQEKICVTTGWIERSNDWAACLPNRIFVTVMGEEETDGPDATTF